ncbi:AI-2E family transporter [Candidatus Parcubacteria bacterium]|nr:AI-2E family transporter [Candidatus Parcubacteria bacterium]
MDNEKTLDISWATILKIAVAGVVLYFLYSISEFLVWFAFAFVIAILFEPAIGWLGRRRIPRVLAVVFIYLSIFAILSFSIYLSLPYFISEVQYFSEYFPQIFPEYFGKISPFFEKVGFESFKNLETFLTTIQGSLEKMGGNIFSAIFVFFGGIFSTVFIITIAIFLSLERKNVEKGLTLFFPKKYEGYLLNAWIKSQKKITGWFFMRIIGVAFVGVSSYIAFYLLNVEYPISLALIAGIFDFVPIIGPFFAAIIAFFIISMDNLLKAVFVLIAFGLIQLIENTILLPVLSRKVIKVSPILVLAALFIGGKFWGPLGAILAVPLAAILMDFFKDFLEKRKEEEEVISQNE